jgi:threonine synthase
LPKARIERLDLGKLYQIIAYGANLIAEDEKASNEEQNSSNGLSYALSPSNPYFAEGEKTSAYEICEQLGWRTPDTIIVRARLADLSAE